MKRTPVTRFVFFGGPEDGRILDAEVLLLLDEVSPERGPERIPMLIELEPGDSNPAGAFWAGSYIAGSAREGTLPYHWAEVDA